MYHVFYSLETIPLVHIYAAECTVFSLNGNDFVIINETRRYKNMGPQVHRMLL